MTNEPERYTARLLALFPAPDGPQPEYPTGHWYRIALEHEPDPTTLPEWTYPCVCLVVATADGATPTLAGHAVVNKVLLDPRTAWMARYLLWDGDGSTLAPTLR